jgi:mRNA-degrading endonuclease RelE of RelBE toxin-antitoxin system
MDAIRKALKKLSEKERQRIKEILAKLSSGKTQGLDVKKLKGREDIFRAKKGDLRVVYRKQRTAIFILLIERRNEGTYDF